MGLGRAFVVALVTAAASLPDSNALTRQQSAGPAFRASTTLIEIDTMVTDKRGKFVADLRPADFELTVDGRPLTPCRVTGRPPPPATRHSTNSKWV